MVEAVQQKMDFLKAELQLPPAHTAGSTAEVDLVAFISKLPSADPHTLTALKAALDAMGEHTAGARPTLQVDLSESARRVDAFLGVPPPAPATPRKPSRT